jgi:hypothetical protein
VEKSVSAQSFLAGVFKHAGAAFEPLVDALESPEALTAFLADFGWTITDDFDLDAVTDALGELPEALKQISSGLTALDTATESVESVESAIRQAIEATVAGIKLFTTSIRELPNEELLENLPPPMNRPDFWRKDLNAAAALDVGSSLGLLDELMPALVNRYIEQHVPVLFGPLRFLGVLSQDVVIPTAPNRQAYVRRLTHWERIPSTFAEPERLLTDIYAWGSQEARFDYLRFVEGARELAAAFQLPAVIQEPRADLLTDYVDESSVLRQSIPELAVPLYWAASHDAQSSGYLQTALHLMPIPKPPMRDGYPAGFVLETTASGQVPPGTLELADNLELTLRGGFETGGIRIAIVPDDATVTAKAGGSVDAEAAIAYNADPPWIILGTSESSRVELGAARVSVQAHATEEEQDISIALLLDRAALVVEFGEGDGFLQSVLGDEPQRVDLSLSMSWSDRSGFGFNAAGQSRLEADIPVQKSIAGFLSVESALIRLLGSLDPQAAATVTIGLNGAFSLGPINVSVEDVGIAAKLVATKEESPGNLGFLNAEFGFNPPKGLGLVVDAGPIAGGGFISRDRDTGNYSGVLQLSLFQITVNAIALIDTKVGDAGVGYSFLLAISTEFTPIQLGLGFTLRGVGGLAALHRSVAHDVVRKKLREGTVERLLFPRDPVANAPQLLKQMRDVFPAARNKYLFGPMCKIGWSDPPIVQAVIGLFLQPPHPDITFLGSLVAMLPRISDDGAIVEIRVNFLGDLSFSKKYLAIDATLHHSHIAGFNLSGDMALRLSWGDNPEFALSLGGFHPAFTAPRGFPALRPLTIPLFSGSNPRAILQSYIAVTSNTLQIGAQFDFYAAKWGASIRGWVYFHALFVRSPFSFIADFGAEVELSAWVGSVTIYLEAHISGPRPWRIWGEACLPIKWSPDICVSFDVDFGDDSPIVLPAAKDPFGELQAELRKAANWSMTLPASVVQAVTIGTPPGIAAQMVILDPIGGVSVRQTVVPLERPITRFGGGQLKQPQTFEVTGLELADERITSDQSIYEHFALNEFEALTEDQRLSSAAFERLPAGETFVSRVVRTGKSIATEVAFKTRYSGAADNAADDSPPKFVMPFQVLSRLSQWSGAAASPLKRPSLHLLAPGLVPTPPLRLNDDQFVIVSASDLSIASEFEPMSSRRMAQLVLAEYLRGRPEAQGTLEVAPLHEVSVSP